MDPNVSANIQLVVSATHNGIDPITAITAKQCFTSNCFLDVSLCKVFLLYQSCQQVDVTGLGKSGKGFEQRRRCWYECLLVLQERADRGSCNRVSGHTVHAM